MQSILVPVTDEDGFECRATAALDIAERFGGHLTFLHGIPTSEYIPTDPFGGAYYVRQHEEAVQDAIVARRAAAEAFMQGKDIAWRFVEARGTQEEVLVEHSRLADLIVLSDPPESDLEDSATAANTSYLVMAAQCPVMSLPERGKRFACGGRAVIAWNGSAPAGKALRAAVPLLREASEVSIVTFGPDPKDFPAEAAAVYLARHGIEATVELFERDGNVAQAMQALLESKDSELLVMGAFSHSRVREFVFGGVSRHFIRSSPVPLFMVH